MPIDWNSKESYQRLLAAVYAASPQNHNYRLIATMFGKGATYDAIEGRFRKIKAEATKLQQEVKDEERPEAFARGSAGSDTTPRRRRATKHSGDNNSPTTARQAVLSGRVTKEKGGQGKSTTSSKKSNAPTTSDFLTADALTASCSSADNVGDDGGLEALDGDDLVDWNWSHNVDRVLWSYLQ